MKKCRAIALVCVAIFGCYAHDNVPQEIDNAINGICDAYNDNVQQARRKERSLSDKIQLIADEKVRNACYLRRIQKMVDSDPEKIDLRMPWGQTPRMPSLGTLAVHMGFQRLTDEISCID